MLPPSLQYIYLSACSLPTLPKLWYIHVSRWVVFSLSQMQVNVQVQMQGGVGDSCIFRRIGIWKWTLFRSSSSSCVAHEKKKISVGIRCFSDIYKDTYHQSYICGIHVSRGILRGLLRVSLFLVINMK